MTAAAASLFLAALAPVPHPDLSAAEPAVREQIAVGAAAVSTSDDDPAGQAENYGALGMIYQAYDLTAAAEVCYRNAIALAPGFRWHYYLGHLLADRGDADAAAAALEAALELDPTYLPARLRLARLRREQRRLDEAQRLYEQVLEADAREAEALTGLARVAFARGEFAAAVELAQAALAPAPHASELRHLLGSSYARMGQLDKAREFLAGSGDVRAERPDPLLRDMLALDRGGQEYQDRGATRLKLGDLQGALRAFERGVAARPDDPRARVNLGWVRLQSGDVEAALADFRAALKIDPNYPHAHFNLGTTASAQGSDEAAIAHYRAALNSDPALVPARLNLANALRRTARFAESIAEYREVIAAEPAHAGARLHEALALVRLGRYTRARERLEEGHRVLPEDPWLRQALVRVLAAAPDPEARDADRAAQLAEGLAIEAAPVEQLAARAMALAAVGRFDEAVRDQRSALEALGSAEPALRDHLLADLERYRKRLPCRQPWRIDGPELSPRLPARVS